MTQAISTIEQDDQRLELAIIRAAQDDGIDIGKLQALLEMQRSVAHERAKRAFNIAMSQAQGEMAPVVRDAVNTVTRSRYARLETIDAAMRPIYTRYGFAVRFGSQPSPREGWIRIICTLSHTGGHFEDNYLDAPPDDVGIRGQVNKTAVQSVGTTVTYLRRYLLCMTFNVVLSDEVDPDIDGSRVEVLPPKSAPRPAARPEPERRAPDPLSGLLEPNGTVWLRNLKALLDQAATVEQVNTIAAHPSVTASIAPEAKTPTLIRSRIFEMIEAAEKRVETRWDTDPLADLLAEVEAMDLTTIAGLRDNAAWQTKLADLFPGDFDRIDEAVTDRRARLTQTSTRGSAPSDGTPTGIVQEALTRDDHSTSETNPGP